MRAVVDIGSNSVKFAVARVQRGVPEILKRRSWVTRLGRDVSKTGRLDPTALAETDRAFSEMVHEMKAFGPNLDIRVVATSAVRDSRNPETMKQLVERHFGVPLRILTGLEEARTSLRGASAAAQTQYGTKACVFIDVGGASTEVGIVEPNFEAVSFQAGAVRCHEALGLAKIPVADAVWLEAKRKIENFFPRDLWDPLAAKIPPTHNRIVAVGGSLLIAARLAGAKEIPSLGYILPAAALESFNDGFRKMNMEERTSLPLMERGRADILCAGLLCLELVMKRLGLTEVFITEWGLRHGLLLEESAATV